MRIEKIKCTYFVHLSHCCISRDAASLRDAFKLLPLPSFSKRNSFLFPKFIFSWRGFSIHRALSVRLANSVDRLAIHEQGCIGTVEQVSLSCFLANFSHPFPSTLCIDIESQTEIVTSDSLYDILYLCFHFYIACKIEIIII